MTDINLATLQHAADGISSFDEAGFLQFGAQAKQLGFDEVLVRRWDPGVILDTHSQFWVARLNLRH
ncbi:MAG: hypothetical protein EB116_09260 [Betaproteobacteria bacterium]|nr:hypothetical protein [Betaproteobacteria bacterium]